MPGADTDDDTPAPTLSERSEQLARNNVRLYPGVPFDTDTLRDDIRRLNRLAVFARVEVFVQLLNDGSVNVIFELVERPVVIDVQISGNRSISDQVIAQEVNILVGVPADRFQIDRAARAIEDLYREKGYYFARVSIEESELIESGIVLFKVREGRRLKVTSIRFEGNDSFKPYILQREINTRTSGLFRKGQLDDDVIERDKASLIQYYRNQGHLDVRADTIITPSPNGREAIVTFLIDEGPQYILRSIKLEFQGDPDVVSAEQIRGLISMKPGSAYGIELLEATLKLIRNVYGHMGYVDAQVANAELRDPDAPFVDLVLIINPGRRWKTGEIVINGNDITRDKVIRRLIDLRPVRPLDSVAIERSEFALKSSRYFANEGPDDIKITIQPPDPARPEYRDVLVELSETNTGSFNIGAAVSSDSGVIGSVSLSQRNFDIQDTPDSFGEMLSGRAFRGAGQTFSIQALPGTEVQNYSISFGEPYLFGSDYSFSTSAFFRDRDFDVFDETRYGAGFGFGRRFGTRWSGGLAFRFESIELDDIPFSSPVDVFQFVGPDFLTAVTFSLNRSTVNDRFRPSRGSVTSLSVAQFGALGGDIDFTRFEASHALYVPIRQDYLGRTTVLELSARTGYIPQDEDEVPVYERFYLGGQDFRGFQFRTISPKGIRADTGTQGIDPVGGTWLFFAGAQITQPIYEEIFSVVAFVDTGTVTFEPGLDDYRIAVGLGARVYVPQLSPAPLAFDFGFPLLEEDLDQGRTFTFSIDIPF